MGKGLGIAGVVIAVMSILAWYGLNFLAVWTACLCAFFAALAGEKGYAVATSIISFASLAFFSPVTAAVMLHGIYGDNPSGASLAIVTLIALAAPILASIFGGTKAESRSPSPAFDHPADSSISVPIQSPPRSERNGGGGGAGVVVLLVLIVLAVSAYWYYTTRMKPVAAPSSQTTTYISPNSAPSGGAVEISDALLALLSIDGNTFPGFFGTQALVFKPSASAITLTFYAFDRRSGRFLAIVKGTIEGDISLLFGEAFGADLRLVGTNAKAVWTLKLSDNGELAGSFAPDSLSVASLSIDTRSPRTPGSPRRTFNLSDSRRQSTDDIVKAQLEFLLGAADDDAKRLAAEQLWLKYQDERAKPAFRQLLLARLALSRDEATASATAERLASIGYDEAKDHLLALITRTIDESGPEAPAVAASRILANHNDPAAAAYARGVLRQKADRLRIPLRAGYAETDQFVCTRLGMALATLLSTTRSGENVVVLRHIFSRTESSVQGRSIAAFAGGVGNGPCQTFYLGLLAEADSPLWRDLKLEYPGWSIFHRMIPGRIDDLRSGSRMPSFDGDRWPLVQPGNDAAASRLAEVARRLGSHDPFGGAGRDINIGTSLVDFESATQARLTLEVCHMTCEPENAGKKLGQFTLTVESSGPNPKQPWTITAVDGFSFDG